MAKAQETDKEPQAEKPEEAKPICGIIMPISTMSAEHSASHWADVRRVIDDAVDRANMIPQIVSDSFESDVIQKRIIHNLYNNPVVVCDVSARNANVMFELGMRITFKKPVIIITDDVTNIPFDTSVIEHLSYTRDLRIHSTNQFISDLSDRIKYLLGQSVTGTYKPFIEAFGNFEIFQPTTTDVSADLYITNRLDDMSNSIKELHNIVSKSNEATRSPRNNKQLRGSNLSKILQDEETLVMDLTDVNDTKLRLFTNRVTQIDGRIKVSVERIDNTSATLFIRHAGLLGSDLLIKIIPILTQVGATWNI